MRIKNINRLIIGHLNVNKIDTKFESLKNDIQGNLDMFVLPETKLDDSYPPHEFNIEGYQLPFRHDRNAYDGVKNVEIRGFQTKEIPNLEMTAVEKPYTDFKNIPVLKGLKKRQICMTNSLSR